MSRRCTPNHILNPEITRSRMYYEMIEQVLPGVKVFIDTSEGGVPEAAAARFAHRTVTEGKVL